MNNSYVIDTMALVLILENRKIPQAVKKIFQDAEARKGSLLIPAIALAEIGYLSEKGRIDTCLRDVEQYCKANQMIVIEPITEEIVIRCFEIDDIPELHDRIIVATGYSKDLHIITNDPVISESNYVSVIW